MSTQPFLRNFNKLSIFIALLILACFLFNKVTAQPYERSAVLHSAIQFNDLQMDDFSIHYAYSGDPSKTGLLFVHGTPGSWTAFERYLENDALRERYFMVSVDRLGWGKSSDVSWKMGDNFARQTEAIAAIMQQHPEMKWIVIGHSLGASIAPKIALASPDSVIGLVLLAGSLDPKLGKPRWYNYAANNLLARWMLPKSLNKSNREIMKLRKELKIMNEQIENTQLNSRVVVMQGMKDRLVSPKNPAYVAENWSDNFVNVSILELTEANHFIPWRQTDLVIEQINNLNQ